jgi:hypothetical protein
MLLRYKKDDKKSPCVLPAQGARARVLDMRLILRR